MKYLVWNAAPKSDVSSFFQLETVEANNMTAVSRTCHETKRSCVPAEKNSWLKNNRKHVPKIFQFKNHRLQKLKKKKKTAEKNPTDLAIYDLTSHDAIPNAQLSGFPQRPTPLRRWRMPHARWVPAKNHTIQKPPMGSPCDISICLRGNEHVVFLVVKNPLWENLRNWKIFLRRFSLGWTLL